MTSAHSIENTRWLLAIEVNGASTTETFDGLVVCTGRHLYPHFPKFQHQERFQGDIIHSMNYKNAALFQGKRLLLVGSGASAADIAVQLCGSADRIYMSVKDGRWIIPHFLRGRLTGLARCARRCARPSPVVRMS